ncbi:MULTISPECIES: DUF1993 domain-containing protein [Pandoraea]|uniref:DUF1993 domain-containing protein n=1 Tax=Pandoraea TaxID=93217 RepID=UPI001F5CF68F|nr:MULTISPECIES: DUF1993 domain-containing protein [Pandoraea]MCI3205505.1 DUF1993 domain-containing protein [Pandoraea sp. LA3]MDN4583533.1 DUF1993 domain-containing protein [Pandoraea capi]
MSITLYRATIPVYLRGLTVMADYLKKAREHCAAKSLDPDTILKAKLAPDMLDFIAQIQRVSDTAKFAVARLTGVESPKFDDAETSFDQLIERITNTEAFIAGILEDRFEGAESRQITLKFKTQQTTMDAVDYLFKFALPNFYFHVTTTHDILRAQGVEVGKMDYLGPFEMQPV